MKPQDITLVSMDSAGMVIFVQGQPRTKGSFKTFGHKKKFAPDRPDSIEMQERIRRHAAKHWSPLEAASGAIAAKVTFFFARPKGHYGTGRNEGKLKESAPEYPISKGRNDLDKLLRLIFDAMTGVVYEDDAQVCSLEGADKVYVDDVQPLEGVLIGVRTL